MQLLLAVLDDLFQFAKQGLFAALPLHSHTSAPLIKALPQPAVQSPTGSSGPVDQPAEELVAAHGGCFIGTPETAVRTDAVVAFDNVLTTLAYGQHVRVLKYRGRWAMVQAGERSGWVLKDALRNSAAEIFPSFANGDTYDATATATTLLRLCIADAFAATEPGVPLTGPEYVTYRLVRAQRHIAWPPDRPRSSGRWQTILRGNPGIHQGVTPRTGAVMEVVQEDQGYLLYVEAVFPDEAIQVSAVGYAGLGVYSEQVLPKEEWRELHPVFIEVN